jgi:hypothetical protein
MLNLRRFLIQWVVPAFGVPAVLALQCFFRYALRWPLPAIILPAIVPAIVVPLLCILGSVASCRRARRRLATLSSSKLLSTSLIGHRSLAR